MWHTIHRNFSGFHCEQLDKLCRAHYYPDQMSHFAWSRGSPRPLPCAHPNGHICQAAPDWVKKPDLKTYLILRGIFASTHTWIAHLAVWIAGWGVIQVCSLPRKWLGHHADNHFLDRAIRRQSIRRLWLLIALSWHAPGRTAVGSVLPWPSDYSLYIIAKYDAIHLGTLLVLKL